MNNSRSAKNIRQAVGSLLSRDRWLYAVKFAVVACPVALTMLGGWGAWITTNAFRSEATELRTLRNEKAIHHQADAIRELELELARLHNMRNTLDEVRGDVKDLTSKMDRLMAILDKRGEP